MARTRIAAIGVGAFLLSGAAWFVFRQTQWNTGDFPPREPVEIWARDLGVPAWNGNLCVADETTLYVASGGMPLTRLDLATGAVRWKSDRRVTGYPWRFYPEGNRVVVCDSMNAGVDILCFDRENGALVWERHVVREMGREFDCVVVGDGIVAAAGADLQLRVYALPDGVELWSRKLSGRFPTVLVVEGAVVCIDADEEGRALRAFDPRSGALLWELPLEGERGGVTALGDHRIVLHTPFSAYDAKSGRKLWEYSGSMNWLLMIRGSDLVCESPAGSITMLDSNTGKAKWSIGSAGFDVAQGRDSQFLYSEQGLSLGQINAANGGSNWTVQIESPGGLAWFPRIMQVLEEGDAVLFVAQDDDNAPHCVYAVDIQNGRPRWAWPFVGYPKLLSDRRMLIRGKTLRLVRLPD